MVQTGASASRQALLTSTVLPAARLTFEQYLEAEQKAQVRSEFAAGPTFAMAGGTARHNRISGNAYLALRLASRKCPVFIADMLLRIEDVFGAILAPIPAGLAALARDCFPAIASNPMGLSHPLCQ